MTFDKMWWKDPQSIQTYPKSENFTKNILLLSAADNTGHHLRNMIVNYKLSSCTWWSLNSAEKSLLCWMWCDVNGQGADAEMTREGGRGRKASCTSGGERVWTNQSADSSQAAVCSANQEPAHSEDYWYYCDMDNVWLPPHLQLHLDSIHRWGTDRHHGPGTFTE